MKLTSAALHLLCLFSCHSAGDHMFNIFKVTNIWLSFFISIAIPIPVIFFTFKKNNFLRVSPKICLGCHPRRQQVIVIANIIIKQIFIADQHQKHQHRSPISNVNIVKVTASTALLLTSYPICGQTIPICH